MTALIRLGRIRDGDSRCLAERVHHPYGLGPLTEYTPLEKVILKRAPL